MEKEGEEIFLPFKELDVTGEATKTSRRSESEEEKSFDMVNKGQNQEREKKGRGSYQAMKKDRRPEAWYLSL